MNKYLLTLAVSIIGFIGFSNAVSFTSDGEGYSPASFTASDTFSVSSSDFSNFTCSDDECGFTFTSSDLSNFCSFYLYEGVVEGNPHMPCVNMPAGIYDLSAGDSIPFSTISLNVAGLTVPSSGGDDGENSGDSDSSSSLISGGTTAFSGIITSLGSAVSEFIPYVAYIGLGLLGAIIGFVAIKRLINRVRAKIFGTFNSRRRK